MKTFGITLFLLTAGLLLGSQQAKSRFVPGDFGNSKIIIMKFLREVYETQDDALKIAHQYIGLEDSPNEFSNERRYEVAAANITLMRKGEGVSSFSPPLNKEELSAIRVVSYTSLADMAGNKLLRFGLDDSQIIHLYVVLKDDIVWKYFYVKDDKIYSFDYLLKGEGGPAYLFSY